MLLCNFFLPLLFFLIIVMRKANILIVDDDQNLIKLIKFYLKPEDYVMDSARNGRKALSMIKKKYYDLILADMQMPEMDGQTLLRRAKNDLNLDSFFIIITAYGQIEESISTIDDGAYDIIQKPFVANRLKLTIRNAINHKFLLDNYNNTNKNDR